MVTRKKRKRPLGELLALVPDFEPYGRSLIQRMVYLDENVDMLAEVLHRAGLEMQSDV